MNEDFATRRQRMRDRMKGVIKETPKKRASPKPPAHYAKIVELYKEGMSQADIARKLNKSYRVVQNAVRKHRESNADTETN